MMDAKFELNRLDEMIDFLEEVKAREFDLYHRRRNPKRLKKMSQLTKGLEKYKAEHFLFSNLVKREGP